MEVEVEDCEDMATSRVKILAKLKGKAAKLATGDMAGEVVVVVVVEEEEEEEEEGEERPLESTGRTTGGVSRVLRGRMGPPNKLTTRNDNDVLGAELLAEPLAEPLAGAPARRWVVLIGGGGPSMELPALLLLEKEEGEV